MRRIIDFLSTKIPKMNRHLLALTIQRLFANTNAMSLFLFFVEGFAEELFEEGGLARPAQGWTVLKKFNIKRVAKAQKLFEIVGKK